MGMEPWGFVDVSTFTVRTGAGAKPRLVSD